MSVPISPVTWITGARGALGQAIATQLHAAGHTVVLSSRHAGALGEAAPGWHPLPLDVTDDAAVQAAAHRITTQFGAVDQVVACAAVPAFGDFLSLSDEDWCAAWDTKFMGAVRVVRAALPGMLERGDGRIVLVSGRGGTLAPPKHLPGASANAAINLLVQGLASAYARQGVRINAVAPGPVASPRLEEMRVAVSAEIRNAQGRAARPQEVAATVAFLLSDAAAHVNGAVIPVDGGRI